VNNEFMRVGKIWIENMYKAGWRADSKTIALMGPYVVPELEQLDMWTFYIGCTFFRLYPEKLTLEQSEGLAKGGSIVKAPTKGLRNLLGQLSEVPIPVVEKELRDLRENSEAEEKLQSELDQINKERMGK
jgi:hypothetical protein